MIRKCKVKISNFFKTTNLYLLQRMWIYLIYIFLLIGIVLIFFGIWDGLLDFTGEEGMLSGKHFVFLGLIILATSYYFDNASYYKSELIVISDIQSYSIDKKFVTVQFWDENQKFKEFTIPLSNLTKGDKTKFQYRNYDRITCCRHDDKLFIEPSTIP